MTAPLTLAVIVHVLISLAGLGSGFIVLAGLLSAKRLDGWTAVFLTTTVLTSVTGFFLPAHGFMPSHVIGILSLLVLGLAIVARYARQLSGGWRTTYVISAMVGFWFNFFVFVVQLFRRVPFLQALAPTQSEPPFAIAQLLVLVLFTWFTIRAVKNFRCAVWAAA